MTYAIPLSLALLAQLSPQPTARTVTQVGADWSIAYSFPNAGPDPVHITPSDLSAKLTSPGLSNSRAAVPGHPAAHAFPRPVAHVIDGAARVSFAALVDGGISATRCRERFAVAVRAESAGSVRAAGWRYSPVIGPPVQVVGPPVPETMAGAWGGGSVDGSSAVPPATPSTSTPDDIVPPPIEVEPGGILHVRVTLGHEHEGNHGLDPLLGRRELSLRIGEFAYRDTIDLAHEQYFHLPSIDYRPMDGIDADRLDDGHYFTPPTSMVLDAMEPGRQYHRFPERKARGGVRMRLRFRYFVPAGCDGDPKVRVAQYCETPNQWRVLSDGGFERDLVKTVEGKPSKNGALPEKPVATWRLFDEVFTTHPECSTVSIDMRIASADIGMVWIDDVELGYVGAGGRMIVGDGKTGEQKP